MTQAIQAIDAAQHREHGFAPPTDLAFAAQQVLCPINGAEVASLLPFYTLAFIKHKETVDMVALTGLYQGENLLLGSNGKWLIPYLPARYRGFPFEVALNQAGEQQKAVLCFDHRSGLYRETPNTENGEYPFFDEQGKPTERVSQILQFLVQRNQMQEATRNAAKALDECGCLVPWELPLEKADRDMQPIKGLYRIDQEALRGLEGDKLSQLMKSNAMALAYAQVFSIERLSVLLKIRQAKVNSLQSQKAALGEDLFAHDEGVFSFD